MLYVPLFLHLAMSMQHPEWLADHYLTGGQIFRHHGTRANFDIITQRHRADDHHVGAEFDVIANHRACPFAAFAIRQAADGGSLAQDTVFTDNGTAVEDDAVRMIQLQPVADPRLPR